MNIKDTVGRVLGRNGEGEQGAADALTVIRNDHREVDTLFETALSSQTRAAQRRATAMKICDALTLHARMEEALFYPALRRAGGEEERDSVLEANEEHGVVKDLIAKIKALRAGDETLEAKLTVLSELVHHHVREEESTIFTEARRVLGDDGLRKVGAEMMRFKQRGGRGGRSGSSERATSARTSTARKSTEPKSTRKKTAARGAAKRGTAKRAAAKRKR